ncbi:MAG: hypothetical protein AAFR23_06940 [Pseudomonadota bacterium]
MSTIKIALPQAASALSFTGATILRLPTMIREQRRQQRALRAINSLDTRTIEDVAVSRAHAMKLASRRTYR